MCLPLNDLPERSLDKGTHAGFMWEIVRNICGHRCGYVRVEPGHPWFGKDYDSIDADVHGGLTFSESGKVCATHDEAAEWWIGFDFAHAGDAPDPQLPSPHSKQTLRLLSQNGVVPTHERVRAECLRLAEQAAAAKR